MIRNQNGGIISKIFIIPIGVALMIGFFFLGYYVGKYQSKTNKNEIVVPLPEVVSNNLPKNTDFTFFKTLTDKDNKTVSIDLKPQPSGKNSDEKKTAEQKPVAAEQAKDRPAEGKTEKPKTPNESESKRPVAKNNTAPANAASSKLRYTLQLASYQEKDLAEGDVKKMKQRGYAAFVVASDIEGKGTWYRVRVGSFSNRASAERLQKELRARASVSSFITIE